MWIIMTTWVGCWEVLFKRSMFVKLRWIGVCEVNMNVVELREWLRPLCQDSYLRHVLRIMILVQVLTCRLKRDILFILKGMPWC